MIEKWNSDVETIFHAHSNSNTYLCVDAARIRDASAILPVGALVDVDATLPVETGVVQTNALDGRSGEAGRARIAAETRNQIVTARSRVARIG